VWQGSRVPELDELDPADPSDDLVAAGVMAIVAFLLFAGLMAWLFTRSSTPDTVAWVGAGLVGVGSLVFAGWAAVLNFEPDMDWARPVGGDLLLVGIGVAFVFAGIPTFFAGVL
jgi:hypothetical protein